MGDRVRIIANEYGHEFDIGEVVTIVKVCADDYQAKCDDGEVWWVIASELIPAPQHNTITTGQTYTMASGRKMRVIHIEDGKAFGVFLNDNGTASLNSAYTWDMDGEYQNAVAGVRDEYRIVFEPVRETVTQEFGPLDGINYFHGNVKVSIETINGTPDWSTAKVTPCD